MPEARQGFNFSFRCVLQRFGRFDSSRAAAEDAARASLALSLSLPSLGFWPQKKYQRTPPGQCPAAQQQARSRRNVLHIPGADGASLGLMEHPWSSGRSPRHSRARLPPQRCSKIPTPCRLSPSPSPSFSDNLRHLALPTPSLAHEEPQEPREAAPAPARGIGRDLNESRARLAIKEVQTPL